MLVQLQRSTAARRAAAPSSARAFGCKREQLLELRGQVGRVPVREARQVPLLGGILVLQAFRDLREARVTGDERRRARSRRLRGDHSERFGEDRRHDRDVGELEQMHEVSVFERAGEERPRRGDQLELCR